ncbi:hypothetical protein BGZ98_005375 [Dissophora globulifera]|nr:hypothetical protein BGZ98_005375 [Dissophora globulifera]
MTNTAVSSSSRASSQTATRRHVGKEDQHRQTAKIQEIVDDEEETKDDDDDVSEFSEVDDEDDSDASDSSDMDEILDPEKWRIIKETGIMEQVQASDVRSKSKGSRRKDRIATKEDEEEVRDFIFEGFFFSIPTTCLFIVMDILVHRQYGETYTGPEVIRKALKVFPAILLMVYFSNKYKKSRFTQAGMFIVSAMCGCYFLHTMFRSPALGIMMRAPGIITILVYCIVQLDLLPAVVSLAICGLYYQFGNVKYDIRR